MKKVPFQITTIGFAFLLMACSNEKLDENLVDLDPAKAHQELNISYGNHANQIFDIYLPSNRTANTKTMILVHGGGWVSGDKADMNYLKDLILAELPNIAIVNMNYRLANSNNMPYPMQIDDISAVINVLKNKKTEYSISDNYGFIGTSAGGHLSLLWSYGFDARADVSMVCSVVGPTNFTDPNYLNSTSPELQQLLSLYGSNPSEDFLEEISPYHQVTASAPSTILFYGGQDPLIPTTQGTGLRDKLASLNVTHQFTLYENESHGWTGLALLDTWTKLKAFIQTHL